MRCAFSNTISSSDLKDKIGDDDAKLLTTTVEDALAWLESDGASASTEVLEAKQKVRARSVLMNCCGSLSGKLLRHANALCRRWRA